MKLIKFMQVQMQRQGNQIAVRKMEVEVNPDHVGLITAATIPSEMSGPDGTPIVSEGTLLLVQGHEVVVERSIEDVRRALFAEGSNATMILEE